MQPPNSAGSSEDSWSRLQSGTADFGLPYGFEHLQDLPEEVHGHFSVGNAAVGWNPATVDESEHSTVDAMEESADSSPVPPIDSFRHEGGDKRKRKRIKQEMVTESAGNPADAVQGSPCFSWAFYRHPAIGPTGQTFYQLYNSEQQNLSDHLDLLISADKNVNFSPSDNSFVHFKQNHFQISTEVIALNSLDLPVSPMHSPQTDPPALSAPFFISSTPTAYIAPASSTSSSSSSSPVHSSPHSNSSSPPPPLSPSSSPASSPPPSLLPVTGLYVDVYAILTGAKLSNTDEEVRVQLFQTGKSRTKEDNHVPEPVQLQNGKASHSRLRFQSSTPHNARMKNSEKNPQQKYYRIVVVLFAFAEGSFHYIFSKASDPLIVRGQNPGRYTHTQPKQQISPSLSNISPWTQTEADSVITMSKVGINTTMPSEALTVNGNVLVTGNVLKPSDKRIKDRLLEVDTSAQLQRLTELKLYDYELNWPQTKRERGVLAQDVQRVMPHAVEEVPVDIQLKDGSTVRGLLVVNERALLMENIGATQELGRIVVEERETVEGLGNRVGKLEEGRRDEDDSTQSTLDKILDFITVEEYDEDTTGMCYCSMCGLGPAWTMWVLGFFFFPLWILGIMYIGSPSRVRRHAGIAHLLSLIMYVIYSVIIYFILPTIFGIRGEWTALLIIGYLIIGVVMLGVLAVYMRKRNKRRTLARYNLQELMALRQSKLLHQSKADMYTSTSPLPSVATCVVPTPLTMQENTEVLLSPPMGKKDSLHRHITLSLSSLSQQAAATGAPISSPVPRTSSLKSMGKLSSLSVTSPPLSTKSESLRYVSKSAVYSPFSSTHSDSVPNTVLVQ